MKVTVDPLTGMPQIVNQETKVFSSSGVINQNGGGSAGTFTFNGQAGARVYGGVTLSSVVITEYKG